MADITGDPVTTDHAAGSPHQPAHSTTGPLAVPAGGHYPAGWVSPEAAEADDREHHRRQIAAEREAADRDDLEAEVDRRLAAARGPRKKPEVRPDEAKPSEVKRGAAE